MKEKTRESLEKILIQAENGHIEIQSNDDSLGKWKYYVQFCTSLSTKQNPSVPFVDIPDYDTFLKKLDSYLDVATSFYEDSKSYFDLNDDSFREKLILDLFINVTNSDCNNIFNYIDTRTRLLQNVLSLASFSLGKYKGLDVFANISKNKSNLEGPYKFSVSFKGPDYENQVFTLPKLTFGIDNKTIHLFSIQNDVIENNSQLCKLGIDLDKHFRDINHSRGLNGFIRNVSPNSLVAFTLFASYFKSQGFEDIIAPDFMPLRYPKTEGKTEEYECWVENNQTNITNKFLYLFLRYNFHFPNSVAEYDELSSHMKISLKDGKKPDCNNIIYDLNAVCRKKEDIKTI